MTLSGKRALVTGSSSGLGEAIATRLAADGAAVIVHGRDQARTARVASAIAAAGGTATAAVGDLRTDAGADGVSTAALAGGPIDILVNNVGIYDPAHGWWDTPPTAWSELYNINVISAVRMIRNLVPAMRERGWGRVIQISSATGIQPQTSQPHYAATNAARINLATALARDLKHSGVTSNVIAAGGILTPSVREYFAANGVGDDWEEHEAELTDLRSPNDAGRIGRPHEYAGLVAYLASPDAGYITGATIRMDGGWYDVPAVR